MSYKEYFFSSENNLIGKLLVLSRNGYSKWRSVAWKVMLEIIPKDAPIQSWSSILQQQREVYYTLKRARVTNREDEGDVEEINKDLERLYPTGIDEDFFEDKDRQAILRNVLLLWCKEHPTLSYRQGMHEILAIIVWSLDVDAKSNNESKDKNKVDESVEMKDDENEIDSVTSLEYLEADAYLIFCALMLQLIPLYSVVTPYNSASQTPVFDLAKRVMEKLQVVRPSLHRKLNEMRIEAQIYILKWARLLFIREYSLESLLRIWDNFIGESCKGGKESSIIASVEYLSISMVLYLEDVIMEGDYSICLSQLMNFPECDDISGLIDYSIVLRHFFIFAISQKKSRTSMLPSLRDIIKRKKNNSNINVVMENDVASTSTAIPITSVTSPLKTKFNSNNSSYKTLFSYFSSSPSTTNNNEMVKINSSDSISTPTKTIKTNVDSLLLMNKMGDHLNRVCVSVESEIRKMEKSTLDTKQMVVNLSELRQISNVLLGNMKEGDCSWLGGDYNIFLLKEKAEADKNKTESKGFVTIDDVDLDKIKREIL